ncbi:MAG: threonylcarbamoyl-AMP synthase [Clostridia bacterium]|nr:threonylcarbamoyl-AMP synthase [Clostridia bacterium]
MEFMITKDNLKDIINQLNNNQVICFKTDTIWGLSANPNSSKAIQKLYTIKHRNLDKPFIFLISKNQNLNDLVESVSATEQKLIDNFWPGPLTIIFKAKKDLSLLKNYRENKTIALRMPDDEICQNLLQNIDYPLPSTSVNIEGQPSLNDSEKIIETFTDEDIYLLTKTTQNNTNNVSSTIVICEGNNVNILREGSISKTDILKCLNS